MNLTFESRGTWRLMIVMGVSLAATWAGRASAQVIYSNSGDNTTWFTTGYADGKSRVFSNGTDIVESRGGRWDYLPVTVSGNFSISFEWITIHSMAIRIFC